MQRFVNNPILAPLEKNSWEALATFNGSVIKNASGYHLLYRAMGYKQNVNGKDLELSTIGHAKSADGFTFGEREQLIAPVEKWEAFGCEDPRITKVDDEYFVFYTALSDFPPYPSSIKLGVATFGEFGGPLERHLVTPFNSKAMVLFPEKINGKYTALLTVNTDNPPSRIAIAQFDKKEDIWSQLYWRRWYLSLDLYTLPLQRMNSDQIEIGAVPVLTDYGWLLIYAHIQNYYTEHARVFGIEAALLDYNNPQKIIGRMEESLLVPEEEYEREGVVPNIVFPSGALLEKDTLRLYYGAADTRCCVAMCKISEIFQKMRKNAPVAIKLSKFPENPILAPIASHNWESKAVLNPAAVYDENRVHIVYRAQSIDNTSVFGYATSVTGDLIESRLIEPIYHPRKEFEDKKKIDGNSGCEDPRITKLGDFYHMCYTAYDGVNPPRVALTSIRVSDFLQENFVWSQPILISPPGIDDKDACILSEKINGKYVIFHRIENSIVLDYVDSLEFNGNTWLRSIDYIPVTENSWDSEKIGIAGPPLKTNAGWVLFYHGISSVDHEYRVGIMLLDLFSPSKVLARTQYPVLEPEERFEREGLVSNVVFPCGNVIIGNKVFVYYGAADTVTCVATIELAKLLSYLTGLTKKEYFA